MSGNNEGFHHLFPKLGSQCNFGEPIYVSTIYFLVHPFLPTAWYSKSALNREKTMHDIDTTASSTPDLPLRQLCCQNITNFLRPGVGLLSFWMCIPVVPRNSKGLGLGHKMGRFHLPASILFDHHIMYLSVGAAHYIGKTMLNIFTQPRRSDVAWRTAMTPRAACTERLHAMN